MRLCVYIFGLTKLEAGIQHVSSKQSVLDQFQWRSEETHHCCNRTEPKESQVSVCNIIYMYAMFFCMWCTCCFDFHETVSVLICPSPALQDVELSVTTIYNKKNSGFRAVIDMCVYRYINTCAVLCAMCALLGGLFYPTHTEVDITYFHVALMAYQYLTSLLYCSGMRKMAVGLRPGFII
jgi:hypothetical protein